jgi:hypothetical protein
MSTIAAVTRSNDAAGRSCLRQPLPIGLQLQAAASVQAFRP